MTQINLKISALLLAALVISSLQPGRSFGAGPDAGAPGSASPAGVTADAAAPGSAKEVLARVNGAPITRAEVDRAIVIFLAQRDRKSVV